MTERGRSSIVIVGGGASGVLLAAHLLEMPQPNLRVTLIEKRSSFGQGVAYSTPLPDHVLNVSALRMGAYADDPEHFWRWLKEDGQAKDDNAGAFVPRSIYGRYLADLLQDLRSREENSGRLHLIHEECLSVTPTAAGVEVRLANGTSVVGHLAILAVGYDEGPPPDQPHAVRVGSEADTPIDLESRVLILGTGLSMIDAWLTLESRGHCGQIVAVSRRGLMPSVHRRTNPIRLDVADIPLGTELVYFVRWFRDMVRAAERSGGDWRDVVDGLRPFNQVIWQNWPITAKRRFVEHTKAWWDIHRHRTAPDIHQRVSDAVASGRIRLVAARVTEIERRADKFFGRLQLRHSQTIEELEAARIYECTGLVRDMAAGSNGVVRSLIDRGLARPDPLRLGLDVAPDCAVVNENGIASDKIYAVGPLTRGAFFEIDAIPDIRLQCANMARHLMA